MKEELVEWDKALTAIEDLYRDIERRSLSLPAFSLAPLGIFIWNYIKFFVFFYLDILLIVPMNLIILLRNIFPGRWRYRSFSGRYWRYAISWIWRGEAPIVPFGIIRPLVMFFLTTHVYSRIHTLRKYIYVDGQITDETRAELEAKIAKMLDHWKRPKTLSFVYIYALPITGPIIEISRYLSPEQFTPWVGFLGMLIISYAITFVISAFMVKRALMLGESSRALYFPGAIAGEHCYQRERDILAKVGIRKKEFPFDLALGVVSVLIGYLMSGVWIRIYESLGIIMPPQEETIVQMVIQGLLFTCLFGLVLYRRKVTGRV